MIIENSVLKKIEDEEIVDGTIIIPETVKIIGDEAFRDCKSLRSIIIPDGVKKIGFSAFRNCNQFQSVTLPKNLSTIGEAAFKSCRELTEVNIPLELWRRMIQDTYFDEVVREEFPRNVDFTVAEKEVQPKHPHEFGD